MRAWLVVVVPCAALSQAVAADGVGERLGKAIVCEGEPQTTVVWLDEQVGKDDPQAKVTASGEEMAYRVDVALKQPITIAGATSTAVVWQVEGEEGFSGVVYARFNGDAAAVAKHLKLDEAKADADLLGKYQRAVPDGTQCPPTILLQPLKGMEFLLGCGWCNG